LSHGRSPRGERVYDAKPTSPGERLSVVAVLTGQGIAAEYLYRGTLTAKVLIAYLETYLLTLLEQGKTLIMDNLPAHHAKSVKQFLQSHNIAYLFTPPYSPEFNPIEEAFSKTKHVVRREKPRTLETLEEVLRKGLKTVTEDDAINYINHSYDYVYVTD
jgi:transposase